MPVLKGEERKVDIWADLAKEIADNLLNPEKLFPQHRPNLEADIEKIIRKFIQKRVIMAYFKVKKVRKIV
jgi:hypothetical protein